MLPGNERFISPARDIAYIAYPVIRGSLEALDKLPALIDHNERLEKANALAKALAQYFNGSVTGEDSIPTLMATLREQLEEADPDVLLLVSTEIMLGFLTAFGLGCRESMDTEMLSDDKLASAVGQMQLLSLLDADLREQVIDRLVLKRRYVGELDRKR